VQGQQLDSRSENDKIEKKESLGIQVFAEEERLLTLFLASSLQTHLHALGLLVKF
jgi:hypothetical protein